MDFRVSNVCVYLCVQFHTDAEIFFRCCVDVVAAALSFQFNGIFHFVDLFSVVFFSFSLHSLLLFSFVIVDLTETHITQRGWVVYINTFSILIEYEKLNCFWL